MTELKNLCPTETVVLLVRGREEKRIPFYRLRSSQIEEGKCPHECNVLSGLENESVHAPPKEWAPVCENVAGKAWQKW